MGRRRTRKIALTAAVALLPLAVLAALVAHAATTTPTTPAPAAWTPAKPVRSAAARVLTMACASRRYGVQGTLVFINRPSQCGGRGERLVRFQRDFPVYVCRKEHAPFGKRPVSSQQSHWPGLIRLVSSLSRCAPPLQPDETPQTLPRWVDTPFCVDRRNSEMHWFRPPRDPCNQHEFKVVLKKRMGNRPPVARPDSAATDETTVRNIAVVANDTDADGNTLHVGPFNLTGTKGSVSKNLDGTVRYDPNGKFESVKAGEKATDTFEYKANDGKADSSSAKVTVTLTGLNDAPVAQDDTATTDKDHALQIQVASNDSDVDGDALKAASVDATGTQGNVTINPDGSVNYDPNGKFDGLAPSQSAHDTFKYRATDGTAGSNTATVDVTVTGVNKPPALSDVESGALAYDTGSGGAAITSTLNASEPDATNLASATVKVSSGFVSGQDTLSFTDQLGITGTYNSGTGVLTLTGSASASDYQTALRDVKYAASAPAPSGSRTISFEVDDGAPQNHASNTQSRDIALTHVNHPPAATDDPASTGEDAPLDIAVLPNDTDPDNDTLHVSSLDTTGTQGTVSINGNNTIHYDPNGQFDSLKPGDTATDSFKYKAADPSNADSNSATVTVTITGANDAPTLTGIEASALPYATGDPATPITSSITTGDVDNTNLKSGTVEISSGYVNGNDTLSFTNTANITGDWVAATHTLSLSTGAGGAPQSEWDTALRSVKFFSSGPTPSGSRTISFQVDDSEAVSHGSNIATRDITVTNDNVAPSDITLSWDTVVSDRPPGTMVGTFVTTDADLGDPHSYSLVDGTGSTDNARFTIVGADLKTDESLATGDYSIRVRTDDGRGGTFDKEFTIHAIP